MQTKGDVDALLEGMDHRFEDVFRADNLCLCLLLFLFKVELHHCCISQAINLLLDQTIWQSPESKAGRPREVPAPLDGYFLGNLGLNLKIMVLIYEITFAPYNLYVLLSYS